MAPSDPRYLYGMQSGFEGLCRGYMRVLCIYIYIERARVLSI